MNTARQRKPRSKKKGGAKPSRRVNYQSVTQEREQQLRAQLSRHAFRTANIGVRYYDLEPKGGKLEDILKKSDVRARYNEDAKMYTSLIDDFDFPSETNSLAMSPDGKYIMAAGNYAPRMKCFDLEQLSMKFERHTDNEIIKILPLSDDFRKFAILERNRWLEFHAQFGRYYNLRLPREGRDIVYHGSTCELLVVGSSDEVHRFDLEQGIFRSPLQLASGADAINCIKISPVHQLFGVGCENGFVECIDPRSRTIAGVLNACQIIQDTNKDVRTGSEITSLQFDPKSSVHFAAGTNMGQVALFDLRKHGAIMVKDHHYETAIRTIDFHDLTENIISSDEKVIKIWNRDTGDNYLNIEFPRIINDVLVVPESGMIICGGTQPFIKPYYVPSLGPAPKWCSFVDNITEELEEVKKMAVHQDFKFVTLDDLKKLGLDSLIGSSVLRPYLHGFFMKMELYKKAIAFHTASSTNGNDDGGEDDSSESDVEEKIEQRWSKARIQKATIDDNDEDDEDDDDNDDDESRQRNEISTVFDDARFKELLNRPEFHINEDKQRKIESKRLNQRMKEQRALEQRQADIEPKVKEVHSRRSLSYSDGDVVHKSKRRKKASFEERIQEETADDVLFSDRKRFHGNQEITVNVSELKKNRNTDSKRDKRKKKDNVDGVVHDEQSKTVVFKQKDVKRRGAERLFPKMRIKGGKPRNK